MTDEETLTLEEVEELEKIVRDCFGGQTQKRMLVPLSLARAHLEAREGGWQTMENAPKDGTRIITFSPLAEGCGYSSVRLNYYRDGVWQKTNQTFWPPTHWMPLPKPPEADHDK